MASSTSRGTKAQGCGCRGSREGCARCQLSRAGCVLLSQDFSLPAAPGFGAGTFTFPTASQEAPEGWVSPSCQKNLVAAPWACGWWGEPGRAQKSTAHHSLMTELLEDAHGHPSLHSHEQDGKTLPGCSACRDAVKAL